MAVPAHDERDFAFAIQFSLPIVPVVVPSDVDPEYWLTVYFPNTARLQHVCFLSEAFTSDGRTVNSGPYNGLLTADFKQRVAADPAAKGLGRVAVNYKLRDWLFSRQHFWGEPFPILRELDDHGQPNGLIRGTKPQDLPLDLPEKMQVRRRPTTARSRRWTRARLMALRHVGTTSVTAANQHHAAMGRVVLVLPPLSRSAERQALQRSAT